MLPGDLDATASQPAKYDSRYPPDIVLYLCAALHQRTRTPSPVGCRDKKLKRQTSHIYVSSRAPLLMH